MSETTSPTVSVRLISSVDDGVVLHELDCIRTNSIQQVKQELLSQMKLASGEIQLSYQGELLSDVTCLHELSSDDTAVVLVITQVATPPTSATPLTSAPPPTSAQPPSTTTPPALVTPPASATPPTSALPPVSAPQEIEEAGMVTEAREQVELHEEKYEGSNSQQGEGEMELPEDGGGVNNEVGGVSNRMTNNREGNTGSVKSVRMVSTTVDQGGGEGKKEVLVKVYDCSVAKPFLGGYRQKATQQEYHNASAQTQPKPRPYDKVRYDRDAQTVNTTNQLQQVMVDTATQMNKNGCFIGNRTDRMILIRNEYETADQYHARILSKVILLQSYWRRWLAQVYVAGVRRDKLRREEWERQEVARRQQERLERAKREFERRMNPNTKTDFDLLFHALEVWRQEQLTYINSVCEGAERKAALCGLMEQEAELIASIGRHKIQADAKNSEKAIMQFLNKVAAPHRWTAYDGLFTYMDTPYTMRAKQLRDIYATLTSYHNHSREERLDLLLTVKTTVKEHDCKLTREIVELIEREADLLVRGIKKDALTGLRKRLATMFFQYCKTPLFNPEVAKHIKVPQDLSLLTHNIHYCKSCRQYLPSTDFELTTNSRFIGHCRACRDLANQAHAREDWSMYREMLKKLREREERMQDGSQLIFLIQEADLCYLVENIWGGQSALSASTDTFELTAVRWDVTQHWSPWNCLVLTEDEAKSHLNLGDSTEAYGPHFVQKVKQRHILAKNYFSHISRLAEELRPKVQSLPLPRPPEKVMSVAMKDTVPPPHLREKQLNN